MKESGAAIAEGDLRTREAESRATTLALVGIAATVALAHVLTNQRYGFHRDELQVLSDALHLDWGFVPYPPWTPLVERVRNCSMRPVFSGEKNEGLVSSLVS